MKKLKKSLLVVPALGVLMLAAAGSVGGTVAWFSSVNTFQTDVSSFAVGRVAGNLDVEMTALPAYGTAQVGNGVVVQKATAGDVKLTHGSFNHGVAIGEESVYTITEQAISLGAGTFVPTTYSIDRTKFLAASKQVEAAYTFKFNEGNWDLQEVTDKVAATAGITPAVLNSTWGIAYTGTPTSNQTLIVNLNNTYAPDTDWMYSATPLNGVNWYHAVSWNMTFKYDFGTDITDRNVYFDMTSSIRVTSSISGTGSQETWKGFRIAFKSSSSTRSVIWAPQQEKANIRYVGGTADVSKYTDSPSVSLLASDSAAGEYLGNNQTSGAIATASANKNYLCQLTNETSSATVNCVAWFEGSDPNVVNAARLDTVAATLKFFAASDNTPTP